MRKPGPSTGKRPDASGLGIHLAHGSDAFQVVLKLTADSHLHVAIVDAPMHPGFFDQLGRRLVQPQGAGWRPTLSKPDKPGADSATSLRATAVDASTPDDFLKDE
jgi:hypothetical protein